MVLAIDASISYSFSHSHPLHDPCHFHVGDLQPASSISTPPLPNEMLPALSWEISWCELAPSASLHGHLPRLLQKWHRWNSRLQILCSIQLDTSYRSIDFQLMIKVHSMVRMSIVLIVFHSYGGNCKALPKKYYSTFGRFLSTMFLLLDHYLDFYDCSSWLSTIHLHQ